MILREQENNANIIPALVYLLRLYFSVYMCDLFRFLEYD